MPATHIIATGAASGSGNRLKKSAAPQKLIRIFILPPKAFTRWPHANAYFSRKARKYSVPITKYSGIYCVPAL